jgi:hypothetical protein
VGIFQTKQKLLYRYFQKKINQGRFSLRTIEVSVVECQHAASVPLIACNSIEVPPPLPSWY